MARVSGRGAAKGVSRPFATTASEIRERVTNPLGIRQLFGCRRNNLKLVQMTVILGIVRYQGCRKDLSRGSNPCVGRTDGMPLLRAFVPNGGPRGAQQIVRMENGEVGQIGFQHSTFAWPPFRI